MVSRTQRLQLQQGACLRGTFFRRVGPLGGVDPVASFREQAAGGRPLILTLCFLTCLRLAGTVDLDFPVACVLSKLPLAESAASGPGERHLSVMQWPWAPPAPGPSLAGSPCTARGLVSRARPSLAPVTPPGSRPPPSSWHRSGFWGATGSHVNAPAFSGAGEGQQTVSTGRLVEPCFGWLLCLHVRGWPTAHGESPTSQQG